MAVSFGTFEVTTGATGLEISQAPTAHRAPRNGRNRSDIRASYDAARPSNLMDKYWANADLLSANAQNSPAVAQILRARSRYEFQNNGFFQRMILIAAHDVIGTAPRVQITSPNPQANRYLESQVAAWSKAAHLGARLRLAFICRKVDGAGLCLKTYNPGINHAVKLGLNVIDVDRLHNPQLFLPTRERIDGLNYDPFGNLVSIDLLKDHPHSDYYAINPMAFDNIPAAHVMYWTRPMRAQQDRTVPENVAVLQLSGQRRRYTQAVLSAAELVASIAGVLKTTSSSTEPAEEDEVGDYLELEIGRLLTLPRGWDFNQTKAEQPTTTFGMFSETIAREQNHASLLPLHKATGDYSQVNFSSGQLGHLDWKKVVEIERHDCGEQHLTPLLLDIMRELALIGMMPETPAFASSRQLPYVPALQGAAGYCDILGRSRLADWLRGGAEVPTLGDLLLGRRELHAAGYHEAERLLESFPHEWFWDPTGEIDAVKSTTARTMRMAAGLSHRRRELGEDGIDIDTADEQAAADLGLTVEEYRRRVADKVFGPQTDIGAGRGQPKKPGSNTVKASRARKRRARQAVLS